MAEWQWKRWTAVERVAAGELSVSDAARAAGVSRRQMRRLVRAIKAEGRSALTHGNRWWVPPSKLAAATITRIVTLPDDLSRLQRCALHGEPAGGIATAGRERREGPPDPARAGCPRPAAPPTAPASAAARPACAGRPDAAVGQQPARLARRPWSLVMPGRRDRRCDGGSPQARTSSRRMRRGVPARPRRDRHGPRGAVEHLHGPARGVEAQRRSLDRGGRAARAARSHPDRPRPRGARHRGDLRRPVPASRRGVERLWGTLQDRLVSELRLATACTVDDANLVLTRHGPAHHARFAVPAQAPRQGESRQSSGQGQPLHPRRAWPFAYLQVYCDA